jgi:hypothetical protein
MLLLLLAAGGVGALYSRSKSLKPSSILNCALSSMERDKEERAMQQENLVLLVLLDPGVATSDEY